MTVKNVKAIAGESNIARITFDAPDGDKVQVELSTKGTERDHWENGGKYVYKTWAFGRDGTADVEISPDDDNVVRLTNLRTKDKEEARVEIREPQPAPEPEPEPEPEPQPEPEIAAELGRIGDEILKFQKDAQDFIDAQAVRLDELREQLAVVQNKLAE